MNKHKSKSQPIMANPSAKRIHNLMPGLDHKFYDMGGVFNSVLGGAAVIPGPQQPFMMGASLLAPLLEGLFSSNSKPLQKNTNQLGNTGFAYGGDLNSLSSSGAEVQANNPNATDSVTIPQANASVDDKEVISGNKVFTSNFTNPFTGKTFATSAKKLESAKGKFEKTQEKMPSNEEKDDEHIEKMLEGLFNTQEVLMTMAGKRDERGMPTQAHETGGKLKYEDGGPFDTLGRIDPVTGTLVDPTVTAPIKPLDGFNTMRGYASKDSSDNSGIGMNGWSPFDKMYAKAGVAGVSLQALRALMPVDKASPFLDTTSIMTPHVTPYEANRQAKVAEQSADTYIGDNARSSASSMAMRIGAAAGLSQQLSSNELQAMQQNQQFAKQTEIEKRQQLQYNNAAKQVAQEENFKASANKDMAMQTAIQSGINLAGSIRTGGNQHLSEAMAMSLLKSKNFKFGFDDVASWTKLTSSDEYKKASPADQQRMLIQFFNGK